MPVQKQLLPLTKNESHIADLIYIGMKISDIAAELERNPQTIKNTLHNVYLKIGVRNRTELTVWVARHPAMRKQGLSPPPQPLSPRQFQVAREVSRGKSNKEIAASLGITVQTVKNHMVSIMDWAGSDTRGGVASCFIEAGFV